MNRTASGNRLFESALADHRAGRLQQAESGYRALLAKEPDHAAALCHLGLLAVQIGRADDGRKLMERAVAIAPDYAEGHSNLGALHATNGRNEEAEACFRRAIDAKPEFADALRNLGTVLVATGRAHAALDYLEKAATLEPLPPPVSLNFAQALAAHDRLDDAEAILRDLLTTVPAIPSPATNLGIILQAQGRLSEAIDAFEEAVRRAPNDGDPHYNLSIALLLAGRYADGWREHEWRRRKTRSELTQRRYGPPLWDGVTRVRSLFVYGEQGLGDIIQFARFLPRVAARAERIYFECIPRLHRLLRSMTGFGGINLVGAPPPAFDAHAGLMSLPHFLDAGLDDVTLSEPYLSPEPALIARWRQRLGPREGLRIGIAWAGTPTFGADAQRSIPLRHFAALAALPNVRLYSLQKGAGVEQLAGFPAPIVDLGPELDLTDAFVDTAAVIASLDLVITSDTSLAHLAGALGAPVWTLLSFSPDWRWMLGRDDSPWYPTMRLFRQTKRGDWDGVFARVASALREM